VAAEAAAPTWTGGAPKPAPLPPLLLPGLGSSEKECKSSPFPPAAYIYFNVSLTYLLD